MTKISDAYFRRRTQEIKQQQRNNIRNNIGLNIMSILPQVIAGIGNIQRTNNNYTKMEENPVLPTATQPAKETSTKNEHPVSNTTNDEFNKVIELLRDEKGNKIEFDKLPKALQDDITTKYNAIISFQKNNGNEIDTRNLADRIENYIKGWELHNFEQSTKDETYNLEIPADGSANDKAKAYMQRGEEYIEYYDTNGNKSLDIDEKFYQKLVEYYTKHDNCKKSEAISKSIKTIKDFEEIIKIYNENPTSTDLSEKLENLQGYDTEITIFIQALGDFAALDLDANSNLSKDEVAAYILTMSRLDSKGNNNISVEEKELMLDYLDTYMQIDETKPLSDDEKIALKVIGEWIPKFHDSLMQGLASN
ncbi:MAG: hypothetical protein MJ237_07670 [bacterium]|nr:hypothetical protein [bacterium]